MLKNVIVTLQEWAWVLPRSFEDEIPLKVSSFGDKTPLTRLVRFHQEVTLVRQLEFQTCLQEWRLFDAFYVTDYLRIFEKDFGVCYAEDINLFWTVPFLQPGYTKSILAIWGFNSKFKCLIYLLFGHHLLGFSTLYIIEGCGSTFKPGHAILLCWLSHGWGKVWVSSGKVPELKTNFLMYGVT